MENTPENTPPQDSGNTQSGGGLLGKIVRKVSNLSADIKKNFHPGEICGASITLDITR